MPANIAVAQPDEVTGTAWSERYDRLLAHYLPFTILTAVAVFIGGVVQILPTVIINKAENAEGVRPGPQWRPGVHRDGRTAEAGTACRAVVGFAIAYNVIAVSLCLVGVMTPLLAAVLMPASSLASLGIVFYAFRR